MAEGRIRVRMKDGTILEGPKGTTRAQFEAKWRRMQEQKRPQFEKDAEAIKNTSAVDLAMGSAPGRFISGVADLGVGGLQFAANATGVGDEYMNRVAKEREEATRRGDLAYGREGFDWMRLMGNVMNPVALKAGKVGAGQGLLGRTAIGGGVGLGFGAGSPVENSENYWGKKAAQAGVGGLVGAAVPLAGAAAKTGSKWLYHALEPIWGKSAIKAREYLHAAGDKADDIIDLLKQNKQHVPGSRPTVGEAAAPAGRAEFSALSRDLSQELPSKATARGHEQQAARTASLRSIAKTPEALEAAKQARAATATSNYAGTYDAPVGIARADQAKLVKIQTPAGLMVKKQTQAPKNFFTNKDLRKLEGKPIFRQAMKEVADDIAKNKGWDIREQPARYLHTIKTYLDDVLNRGPMHPSSLSKTKADAVADVKKELVEWMNRRIPGYNAARERFAADSRAINKMAVGQELQKTLNPPIKNIADVGTQKTAPWMAAQQDASSIIKKAGGDPRFTGLKEVFNEKELAKLEGITKDLARRAQFEEQARAGSKTVEKNIIAKQMTEEAGASGGFPMLNRTAMLLNNALRRLQGKAGKALRKEMAEEQFDPLVVAEIMEKARLPKSKIARYLKAVMDAKNVSISTTVAGPVAEQAGTSAVSSYDHLKYGF